MKPREFDDLIRQKFDKNDFEYNPRNWDTLNDQMDGRAKKRSIIMWWLMPVAGIAASVAMAMGVMPPLKTGTGNPTSGELAQAHKAGYVHSVQQAPAQAKVVPTTTFEYTKAVKKVHKQVSKQHQPEVAVKEEKFGINYENILGNKRTNKNNFNLLNSRKYEVGKNKNMISDDDAIATFDHNKVKKQGGLSSNMAGGYAQGLPEKKPAGISIILSGGYSHGNQNSGYTAGATIRKVVSDKVYVEGEVAYSNSSINQNMYYRDPIVNTKIISNGQASGSKTGGADQSGKPTSITYTTYGPVKTNNVTYDLSYAQLSPSIGYKLMKRVSIGLGPDFQQALSDNRPVASETDPNTIKKMPLFDVGMIGKTEFSITKNLKAGVAYRKGMNNMLTPMGKFIDRDYLQFQVKCAVFNK